MIRARRTIRSMSILVGVTAAAVLSPLLLVAIGQVGALDWVELSNIGQAYGAASAVFSALALTGVVVSVGYQARAANVQRAQAVREQHRELLRLMIDDPQTYAPVWSSRRAAMPKQELRREIFAQMTLLHLETGYVAGFFTAEHIKRESSVSNLFVSDTFTNYWSHLRPVWLDSEDPVIREFGKIVDAGYQERRTKNPPFPADAPSVPAPSPAEPERQANSRAGQVLVAVSAAIAVAWIARSRRTGHKAAPLRAPAIRTTTF